MKQVVLVQSVSINQKINAMSEYEVRFLVEGVTYELSVRDIPSRLQRALNNVFDQAPEINLKFYETMLKEGDEKQVWLTNGIDAVKLTGRAKSTDVRTLINQLSTWADSLEQTEMVERLQGK